MSDEWPKRHPPGGQPEWGIGRNRYPTHCFLCRDYVPAEEGVVMPWAGSYNIVCAACWGDESIPSIQVAIHRKQWNRKQRNEGEEEA